MPCRTSTRNCTFPLAGLDLSRSFTDQPPREVQRGLYSRSTPAAANVCGYESESLRLRGGTRAGLSQYVPGAAVAGWINQDLNVIVSTGSPVQTSLSGRVVTLVTVQNGDVYYARAGESIWTAAANTTGNTPPLNFNGVAFSAPNQQKLFFADGVNEAYFDPKTGQVRPWVATAGVMPRDTDGSKPRLICTYRGRTVVSGFIANGQQWFMSKSDDPFNWNYGDVNNPAGTAVSGVDSPAGLVGDTVRTLIAWSDDTMLFGCDSSIWMMQGDPTDGGKLGRVTDGIGMAWGSPWCKSADNTLYFATNQGSVMTMVPGGLPVPISQGIHQLLLGIDTGANILRMAWDHVFYGVWLFVTPLSGPRPTTHYFYEARTGAWWPVQFANANHNPLCCCVFDGNLPNDRAVLIGSWDGYVRKIDPAASTDDGTPIQWNVLVGPLKTADFDEIRLDELVADVAVGSSPISWDSLVGATAEIAAASTPVASGTWVAGRNNATPVRRAGHAHYIRLSGTGRAALERIRARVATTGTVRARTK